MTLVPPVPLPRDRRRGVISRVPSNSNPSHRNHARFVRRAVHLVLCRSCRQWSKVDDRPSAAHHGGMTEEHGPPPTSARERFLDLLRRELLGCDVGLVDTEKEARDQECPIERLLPNGQWLVVTPGPEAPSLDALTRRLEVLLECFEHTIESSIPDIASSSRPAVPISLQRELQALALRVQAVDALVIDVQSPVIWCSAVAGPTPDRPDDFERSPVLKRALTLLNRSKAELIMLFENDEDSQPSVTDEAPVHEVPPPEPIPADDQETELPAGSRRAIEVARCRTELRPLYKGGRPRHVLREDDLVIMARVFADIYVLLMVFENDVDEVLVERAMTRALPKIEQLVLALPPLEPTPQQPGRIVRLRRP